MHVLRFRFFKLAVRCGFVPLLCLGAAGCDPGVLDLLRGGLGDGLGLTPSTGLGGSCSDFSIDIVSTPSAAMKWNWGGFDNASWGLTDGTWVDFMNTDFVPFAGWTVGAGTRGLAFSMTANDGLNSNVFMLEYTLPRTICPAYLAWDAQVSMELPNGVCVCDSSLGCSDCSASAEARAHFQLLVIEDPMGQMSVVGSGRQLLEAAIVQALDTAPAGDVIFFGGTDRTFAGNFWRLQGDFDVLGGVEPRLFIGVAAQMGWTGGGLVCTNNCFTSPDDSLLEEAVLLIEGGGGIGLAMTRIE